MPNVSKQRLDKLKVHWTFEDVLLLALAYLPEGPGGVTKLTAEAGPWHQAVVHTDPDSLGSGGGAPHAPTLIGTGRWMAIPI